jgi:hypothetical protein
MSDEATSPDEGDEYAGDGEYVVKPGDCLSSIAFAHGMNWRTLWQLPANAGLRAKRKDPNVLRPGDRVHIPVRQTKHADAATDKKHTFTYKGIPEKLRLVLRDVDGNARPRLRYRLNIDRRPYPEGQSNDHGVIEISIPPSAKQGELVIVDPGGEGEESYSLKLGSLDPITTVSGVQGRLRDQGYDCGPVDGIMGPKTRAAIKSFQNDEDLPATGHLDDDTRDRLKLVHGF